MDIYNVVDTVMSVPTGITAGINTAKEHITNKRKSLKNIEQVTLADIFHKKLYGFVDFDYILEYLRSNQIAACENMHTIKSLSQEIVPALTKEALTDRDVKKVSALYTGVMRLCKRKRKGLLAYLSTEGHAYVCLIKSWPTFMQYAGFTSSFDPKALILDSEKVFPVLSQTRKIRSTVGDTYSLTKQKENKQDKTDIKANTNFSTNSMQTSTFAAPMSSIHSAASPDLMNAKINISKGGGTSIFSSSQGVDYGQILAMNFDKFLQGSANWDSEHEFDTFLYFLYSKQYPTLTSVATIGEFFNNVVAMFSTISFTISESVIRQLSGQRMHDLRNAMQISQTTSPSPEIDAFFDTALKRLAVNLCAASVDTHSSWKEIYETEANFVNAKRNQILTKISSSDTILAVLCEEQFNKLSKFVPDLTQQLYNKNNELFKSAYSKAASGVIDHFDSMTEFDSLSYMLVSDALNIRHMKLNEFPSKFVAVMCNLGITDSHYWSGVLASTHGGVCLTLRVANSIFSESDSKNAEVEELLRRAISKFYSYQMEDEITWQQIYLGIRRLKNNKTEASITTKSAIDVLGIDLDTDVSF